MRLIIIDGVDTSGKTTLISHLLKKYDNLVKLEFPKRSVLGGPFKINTVDQFELVFSFYKYLDPKKIYINDRGIVSNLVYDRILRDETASISDKYRNKLLDEHDVLEIFLSRNKIEDHFEDDLISMPKHKFNQIIDEYKKYGTNYQILEYDRENNIVVDNVKYNIVLNKINKWIIGE